MYFLNQLINYAKVFFKNINIYLNNIKYKFFSKNIKLKHQKMTSHLYFTVFSRKVSFSAFSNREDTQPQLQDRPKNGQSMAEVQGTKTKTCSQTSEKLCCQSVTAT